ncbi:ADAMTS-like protein 2 isoform X2 [Ptychodera flava]|uniref:ADAMTS-like protein 2 isoform X2 n=1 Tax=Ptychodera flava TaxID=63121 RepID=UPI00396A83B4
MERWSFLGFFGLVCLFISDKAFGQRERFSIQSSTEVATSEGYQWGPWSGWTECTRPCDTGASLRLRRCLKSGAHSIAAAADDLCEGQNREYKACNTEPCPPWLASDFRAEQCSSFDKNLFYRGSKYQWKPYVAKDDDLYDPCSLVCYATEDPQLVIPLTSSVLDGTPCASHRTGAKSICVAGKCESIGCDGKLYSTATVDQCGVCNGNGTTCRTVRRHFHHTNISTGYTEIVRIPSGATNIKIIKNSKSDSTFLALKSGASNDFYINGQEYISASLKFEISGTTVHYTKPTDNKSDTSESLTATGPTKEPLVLMLLAQEVQPVNILYQFTTQHRPSTRHRIKLLERQKPSLRDHNHFETKGELKADGEPFLKFDVPPTIVPLSDIQHVSSTERSSRYFYNEYDQENVALDVEEAYIWNNKTDIDISYLQAASFYWEASLAPCSATCSTGLSVTYARCFNANNRRQVEDRKCDETTRPEPLFMYSCYGQPCNARWVESKWSQCSVTCGNGVQYRSVRCWRMISEGLDSSVSNSQCDENNKPSTTRPCEAPACGPQWETSEWSECSRKCGRGIRTRQVRCSLPDNSCTLADKPKVRESCNNGPCQRTGWAGGRWSECSKPCGTKERTLFCISEVTGIPVEDSLCDSHPRPRSRYPCDKDCDPMWVPQSWESCTSECGTKKREVLCGYTKNGTDFQETNSCDRKTKPEAVADCREGSCEVKPQWFTTGWSQCSKSCGQGIKSREVSCYLNNAPATGCIAEKPPTLVECVEATCPVATPASDCKESVTNYKCDLVVQNNLCNHWFYKRACCDSCDESGNPRRGGSNRQGR